MVLLKTRNMYTTTGNWVMGLIIVLIGYLDDAGQDAEGFLKIHQTHRPIGPE